MPLGFLTEAGPRPDFAGLYGATELAGGYPDRTRANARDSDVADWIRAEEVRVLNVAGNRESSNPGIGARVERFLVAVFRRLGRG
jgi:hypothetical protein